MKHDYVGTDTIKSDFFVVEDLAIKEEILEQLYAFHLARFGRAKSVVHSYDKFLEDYGDRRICITITYGHYSNPSIVVIELEGSPTKFPTVFTDVGYADSAVLCCGRFIRADKQLKCLDKLLSIIKHRYIR